MHTFCNSKANAGLVVGQSSATAFPPPFCGGGTGRGSEQAPNLFVVWSASSRVSAQHSLRAGRLITTPLPVPPPQGGREPCGPRLRASREVSADDPKVMRLSCRSSIQNQARHAAVAKPTQCTRLYPPVAWDCGAE